MHHHLFQSSQYVEWDETLEQKLSPDDLIDALAEDVLRDGNLDLSLQRAFRWGTQWDNGQGLNDLLQRLRQQRQELLDKFDFGSSLDDIRERLDDIIRREKDTLDDRIESDRNRSDDSGEGSGLSDFFQRRKDRLDKLPPETSAQIRDLQNYEFVDEQAGKDFADLVASMQQQIMDAGDAGLPARSQRSIRAGAKRRAARSRQAQQQMGESVGWQGGKHGRTAGTASLPHGSRAKHAQPAHS
jgi:uncharacterized protein with von Willebrand factor type A (vWA) domain